MNKRINTLNCVFRRCSDRWEEVEADALDDLVIEVCTNCGAYYTPHKGQDYYDTRCGRCG